MPRQYTPSWMTDQRQRTRRRNRRGYGRRFSGATGGGVTTLDFDEVSEGEGEEVSGESAKLPRGKACSFDFSTGAERAAAVRREAGRPGRAGESASAGAGAGADEIFEGSGADGRRSNEGRGLIAEESFVSTGDEDGAAEMSSGSGGDGHPHVDAGHELANTEESSAASEGAKAGAAEILSEGSEGDSPYGGTGLRPVSAEESLASAGAEAGAMDVSSKASGGDDPSHSDGARSPCSKGDNVGCFGDVGANAEEGGENPSVAPIQDQGRGRRTTPYRGVCWKGAYFVARISFNRKQPGLGHFKLAADAALAYDVGLRRLNLGDRQRRFNFTSREEYADAARREAEQRECPSVYSEESFALVSASAEAKAEKILDGRPKGAVRPRRDGERPRTSAKRGRATSGPTEGTSAKRGRVSSEPMEDGRYAGARKKKNSYESWIRYNREDCYMGRFKLRTDAALAFDVGSIKLKGTNCGINFSSKEEYAAAVRREVEQTGEPQANAEESFAAVSAAAEARVEKILLKGLDRGGSSPTSTKSSQTGRDGHNEENRGAGEGGTILRVGSLRRDCKVARYVGARKKPWGYESRVYHQHRRHYMGHFKFEADAALAYDIGSKKLRGTDRGLNFSSREEYMAAVQREVERTGRPSINVEESFAALSAAVEAKAERILSKGSGVAVRPNRGGSRFPKSVKKIRRDRAEPECPGRQPVHAEEAREAALARVGADEAKVPSNGSGGARLQRAGALPMHKPKEGPVPAVHSPDEGESGSDEEESDSEDYESREDSDEEDEDSPTVEGEGRSPALSYRDRRLPLEECARTEKKEAHSYMGVDYMKKNDRYSSMVRCGGKQYFMGCFESLADAALAYDIGSKMLKVVDHDSNFWGKEDYALAVREEGDRAQPVNAEEAYTAVLAKVKQKVAKMIPGGADEGPRNNTREGGVGAIHFL